MLQSNVAGDLHPSFFYNSSSTRSPKSGRWNGRAYVSTPKRDSALKQLREWERRIRAHEVSLQAARDCMGGRRLLQLARAGKVRPYALPFAKMPPVAEERGHALTAKDLHALSWVVAVEDGCGQFGLVATLGQLAELLGCCLRTAGSRMRRLVAMQLLDAHPDHVRAGAGHARLANIYRVTAFARSLFGLDSSDKNCQASDNPEKYYVPSDARARESKVSPTGDAESIVTVPAEGPAPHAKRVKTRPESGPGSSNELVPANTVEESIVRGAPQRVKVLEKQLSVHADRIERNLRREYSRRAPEIVVELAKRAPKGPAAEHSIGPLAPPQIDDNFAEAKRSYERSKNRPEKTIAATDDEAANLLDELTAMTRGWMERR